METQPIDFRVDSLEDRVTQLEQQLGPDGRDPSRIVPLRTELRAEFSAVRGHLASLDAKFERVDARFVSLESKIDQQGIQMRVLHEEVISRIALISEGGPATRRKPRKK